MALIGDGRGDIHCEDALAEPGDTWTAAAQSHIKLGTFDVVVTNPPFGSKIKVTGAHKLAQYKLARKWKAVRRGAQEWIVTDDLQLVQPPQILFIERCIQLLRPGGRLAIILPESIFGMPVYSYVVKWLYENYKLQRLFHCRRKYSSLIHTLRRVCSYSKISRLQRMMSLKWQ
jgi:type I restriction enzyme M protein